MRAQRTGRAGRAGGNPSRLTSRDWASGTFKSTDPTFETPGESDAGSSTEGNGPFVGASTGVTVVIGGVKIDLGVLYGFEGKEYDFRSTLIVDFAPFSGGKAFGLFASAGSDMVIAPAGFEAVTGAFTTISVAPALVGLSVFYSQSGEVLGFAVGRGAIGAAVSSE
jgi:hypothetical protein